MDLVLLIQSRRLKNRSSEWIGYDQLYLGIGYDQLYLGIGYDQLYLGIGYDQLYSVLFRLLEHVIVDIQM